MKLLSLALLTLLNGSLAFAQDNKLGCDNVINFSDFKGMTYLSFMEEAVKPTMDEYAMEGYVLKGRAEAEEALKNVSGKVRWAATKAAGSKETLLDIADELEGQVTNMYELPGLIASVYNNVNRYKLATFFGLVNCAGAIVQYAPGHYAYNIHYGTGDVDKDERTGRSFGEGHERDADDASDKNYLRDLEEFGLEHESSMNNFYSALVKSLSNSDSSDMKEVSDFGKTLLTDFLAVYTAEQARNLMDGRISLHWDAALLEVTLLGAFHAGQDQVKLFYKNPNTGESSFTSTVLNQDTGCSVKERKERSARVYDYWQFSSSVDPSHCRRSGINITKKSFRKLGELISKYQEQNSPELVNNVLGHIGRSSRGKLNIFKQLSKFYISSKTAKALGEEESNELAKDFSAFLAQVKKDAKKITVMIENGEL
ncbi:MAG: hypothetical protein KC493_07250 [Bacteriovoracaceae bacterium]|nr:hypothetical protein [Bacteriovoracaceae bacterium]